MMLRRGSRVRAFLLVTGLAIGAGAALGVLVVGGLMLVASVTGRGLTVRDLVGLLVLGAAWGAVFGFALGPLTAFGLLRAVPLGRSILRTATGAVLGTVVTFVFATNPFVAIPVGFLAGALYARQRYARPRLASESSEVVEG